MDHANIYRIFAALLSYPEQELLDALEELKPMLSPSQWQDLSPLFAQLEAEPLVRTQERYVETFDRNPSHSLHLFEHIHGESRDRGQAMVDLLQEYRSAGFEPCESELPDYVPVFIEFLSVLDHEQAEPLLNDAVHVLAAVGKRLAKNLSPYAGVFDVLVSFASVEPQDLKEPPVRDMDEAMETFGPGADGVEPLLKPQDTHTIQFHTQRPPLAARV
ncbi:nitrate reductase molybdenum cofactor assembly chaperone [Uliginosibacterium flavum]|uniref:Nitrate reductase molybdenum cofactor assembly chaperone n=1 Tax=Uliginosibacterium flavum TaxID=1396831 RepID=A0ABV2TQ69_9RHOO